MAVQDDFQSLPTKRVSHKKRLYIGNLPGACPDLSNKLVNLFESLHVPIASESVSVIADASTATSSPPATCHAFIECEPKYIDPIISKLNRRQFEGRRLTVSREKRLKDHNNFKNKKSSFPANTWTAPQKEATPTTEPVTTANDPTEDDQETGNDPISFQTKSLAALMADYGEQDVDWKKAAPVNEESLETKKDSISVLGQHGKAPIHVTVKSFGYRHGAPPDKGWSHAQPFSPFDMRHIEPVPHYLAWQHGLSASVKYALMRQDKEGVIRSTATKIATQVATALERAINEGNHGYALPLHMNINIGSENGQHRSVLMSEQIAMGVRRILRENSDCRFASSVKVSVGTSHRDMERKTRDTTAKPKQKDLEDE